MQSLRLHPDLLCHNLHFTKMSKYSVCTVTFKKHCLTPILKLILPTRLVVTAASLLHSTHFVHRNPRGLWSYRGYILHLGMLLQPIVSWIRRKSVAWVPFYFVLAGSLFLLRRKLGEGRSNAIMGVAGRAAGGAKTSHHLQWWKLGGISLPSQGFLPLPAALALSLLSKNNRTQRCIIDPESFLYSLAGDLLL